MRSLPWLAGLFPLVSLLSVLPHCSSAQLVQPTALADAGPGTTSPDAESPVDPGEPPPVPTDPTDPDAGPIPDGPIPTTSDVTVQVMPSDKGQAIIDSIKGAKTSVHATLYLLTGSSFEQAFIDAKKAGRDVKVVLNKNFPDGSNGNLDAFDKLKAAGVNVAWAPAVYTFTHAKTILIDAKKAWIMTMNLTFTSPNDNREFLVQDNDLTDVADLEKVFDADFNNKALLINTKLVLSPANATSTDARKRLLQLVASAKTSLEIEAEGFGETQLTDAIIAAHARGVAVKVVLESSQSSTTGEAAAIAKLKDNKVPVVGVTKPYIHAKTIVVDGTRAFVGSQNFTFTALVQNREIGVIFDAPAEVAKVRNTITLDYGNGKAL